MKHNQYISYILIPLLSLTYTCNSMAMTEESLVNHTKESIIKAYHEESKLTPDVLTIAGYSSPKVRHLLNNLCSLPNANYLEIGVMHGSTFISALYENSNTTTFAVAIDNWSGNGVKSDFLKNTATFLPGRSFTLLSQDCFTVHAKDTFKHPINIYFYDGNHSAESQEKAFTYYNDIFSDIFIAIIDDWNREPVRIGTYKAFSLLKYTILFEQILPADQNADIVNWWNGLYVAVIKK